VVIFVINEDWLDSIPCNQEFEAVITRKRRLQPKECKDAIIFVDITNEKFNQRWGAKLPQVIGCTPEQAHSLFSFNISLPLLDLPASFSSAAPNL